MKYFYQVRDWLLAFGKKWILEWLFKKIFGAVVGGIKGWLLTKVYEYLWKKVIKPKAQEAFRWVTRLYKDWQYQKKAKKVKEADNEDDWDSSVDNLP